MKGYKSVRGSISRAWSSLKVRMKYIALLSNVVFLLTSIMARSRLCASLSFIYAADVYRIKKSCIKKSCIKKSCIKKSFKYFGACFASTWCKIGSWGLSRGMYLLMTSIVFSFPYSLKALWHAVMVLLLLPVWKRRPASFSWCSNEASRNFIKASTVLKYLPLTVVKRKLLAHLKKKSRSAENK